VLSTAPRIVLLLFAVCFGVKAAQTNILDPKGAIHIPIGVPDSVDTLKTFVEREGNFSPGFGTYGIYFWAYDQQFLKFVAPTMPEVQVRHGLPDNGALIPWVEWPVGKVQIRTEIAQAAFNSPFGSYEMAAARVRFKNHDSIRRKLRFYVALRSLGAAGGPVNGLRVAPGARGLLVDERTAIAAEIPPNAAGVLPDDSIGELAAAGLTPSLRGAESDAGLCSGALVYDIALAPGAEQILSFVLPVLPGRRAVAHKWDGKSQWAQFDELPLNHASGQMQPDLGFNAYVKIDPDDVFSAAREIWTGLNARFDLDLPDKAWEQGYRAMLAHLALNMNEGAPDVSVINYNVYNRDGVYIANILQKSGNFGLAERAINYFLAHPFNGRIYPEADNPGQILWIAAEHWRFTRDREWLAKVYPSLQKLGNMIQYYRTMPGPHFVSLAGIRFGTDCPPEDQHELKPGRCDGFHPEYTEAFDIAGLRGLAELATVSSDLAGAELWSGLAAHLQDQYTSRFGKSLAKEYGSYSVLWPCRLSPLDGPEAETHFGNLGPQQPAGWRYFPLAKAHQSLLAGNRGAGHATLDAHFAHEQMRGWHAFDEGGPSGAGGWNRARTTWQQGKESVAMPHGWALAEMQLLLRDALLFEDGNKLVLFAGVPSAWFTGSKPFGWASLPTHFGPATVRYSRRPGGGDLLLAGLPPAGEWLLRLPPLPGLKVTVDRKEIAPSKGSDYPIPASAKRVALDFRTP